MKTKKQLLRTAFEFKQVGYGQWVLKFTSPNTGKMWVKRVFSPTYDEWNDRNREDNISQNYLINLSKFVKS